MKYPGRRFHRHDAELLTEPSGDTFYRRWLVTGAARTMRAPLFSFYRIFLRTGNLALAAIGHAHSGSGLLRAGSAAAHEDGPGWAS